jgi:outer membrane lipoprotein SlyB
MLDGQIRKPDIALRRLALPFLLLAGCSQSYSPNTYASTAAQQQATVERGVIIGVRQILISPDGTVGAATGGAVGAVAGAQVPGNTVATAVGAIGGTLVGGISGAAAQKAVGNVKGWEYIVQETGDKLVSVTQTSKVSLPLGLSVLVIAGSQQARIVPDYTVQVAATALAAKIAASSPAKPDSTGNASASTEVNLSPLPPIASPAASFQLTPDANGTASDPIISPQPAPASASPTAAPATPTQPSGEAATSSTPPASTPPSPSTPAATP